MIKFNVPKNPAYKIETVNTYSDTDRPLVVKVTHRKSDQSLFVNTGDLYECNYPKFLENAPQYVQAIVYNLLDYRGGYNNKQIDQIIRVSK